MAITSGAVANIKVSRASDLAAFWMEEEDTGTPEMFILWDPPSTPFDPIYHNAWLSMLRDAIAHSWPVSVAHADDSDIVTELTVARPAP
jgi:hypothetical protein